jgi:hypothetical protein
LQISFCGSVALYLVRNTSDEDSDGGRSSSPLSLSLLSCVDLMGDGTPTLQKIALNCASSGVPVTNSYDLDNSENVIFLPLTEIDDDNVQFIASPVYFSGSEKQSQRSLNDIQAVIVVHHPESAFEALDIDILDSVANHVGEVFRDKNEHLNIVEGIGNVRDINLCDEVFSLRLECLSRIPSHVAREVFLRINIFHGTESIAEEYQVRTRGSAHYNSTIHSKPCPATDSCSFALRSSLFTVHCSLFAVLSSMFFVHCCTVRNFLQSPSALVVAKKPTSDGRRSSDADEIALKSQFHSEGGDGFADFQGDVASFGITVRNLPLASKIIVTCHNSKNQSIIGHFIVPVFSEDKTLHSFQSESHIFVHAELTEHMRDFESVGAESSGNMVLDLVSGCACDVKSKRHNRTTPLLEKFKHVDTEQLVQTGYSDAKKRRRSSMSTKTAKRDSVDRRGGRSSMQSDADVLSHSKFLPEAVKNIILSVHLEGLTNDEKKLLWMSRREVS